MTDSSRPKAATTTSQRPARLADKHDEAAVAPLALLQPYSPS